MDLNPDITNKINHQFSDFQREERERLSSRAKKSIQLASNFSYGLALLIALAVVLSLPFPFVRRNWMKELWGYYGLLNAGYFFMIASGINHRTLSLHMTALGILIYDQLRTWHSFLYLCAQKGVDLRSSIYLSLSLLLTGVMGWVFASAIHDVCRYQLFKRDELKLHSDAQDTNKSFFFKTILISPLFYLLINFTAQQASLLEPRTAYGALRILGGVCCAGSFYVMGKIIDRFLKKKDFKKIASQVILLHLIFLIITQYTITVLMPISRIIE